MANFDVQAAKQAGYNDQEINQFMQQNGLRPKKTLEGGIENLGKSAYNWGEGTVKGVLNIVNPDMDKNTVANIMRLADGIVQHIGGYDTPNQNKEMASALGQHFINRYKSIDAIGDTIYQDPVGFLSDVSTVLTLGGKGVTQIGKLSNVDDIARAGNMMSKVGMQVSPIGLASSGVKGVYGGAKKVAQPFMKTAGDQFIDMSDELSMKSLRPSPSQQRKFKDLTDKSIPEYRKEIGQFGGAEQTVKDQVSRIASAKGKYNAMVRSGEIVDPSDFLMQIKKQAQGMMKTGSPEDLKIAKDMLNRADMAETAFLQYMVENNSPGVPIDMITHIKSTAFQKVPQGSMADPYSLSGGKLTGGIGKGTLDTLAKGSSKLGDQLQADILLKNIAEQQSGLGKGTQLINAFKPVGYGSGLGGMLGGVKGAVAGAITAGTVNSPKFLEKASKASYKIGQSLKKGQLPDIKYTPTFQQYTEPISALERSRTSQRKQQQTKDQAEETKRQYQERLEGKSNDLLKKTKNRNPFTKL